MKIGKKALSLVLALTMAVGTFASTAAFAAAGEDGPYDSCYVDSQIEQSGLQGGIYFAKTLDDALTKVKDSGTVYLNSDITVQKTVDITKPVTLDGKDADGNIHTIMADAAGFTASAISTNNHVLDIYQTHDVTVKNVKVDGAGKARSGIIAWNSQSVVLENSAFANAKKGIDVDSSDVTLEGTITLTGNAWGGMEIHEGEDGLDSPKLTIGENGKIDYTTASEDLPAIWVDFPSASQPTDESAALNRASGYFSDQNWKPEYVEKTTGDNDKQVWYTYTAPSLDNIDYADYHDSYYYEDDSYTVYTATSVQFTWKGASAVGGALTWSSTQTAVATVDAATGVVTPQKPGRTFVKAVNGNGDAVYFKVTVEEADGSGTGSGENTTYTLDKVAFWNSSETLAISDDMIQDSRFQPRYTYSYTTTDGKMETVTTYHLKNNETVAFSTSDDTVVEVEPSTGAVWAKKVGTADITATVSDKDGKALKTATVTVTVPDLSKYLSVAYSYDGTFSTGSKTLAFQTYYASNRQAEFRCDTFPEIPSNGGDAVYFKVPCDANQNYYFYVGNGPYSLKAPVVNYDKNTGTAIFQVPVKFLQKSTDLVLGASGDSFSAGWLSGNPIYNTPIDTAALPVGVYKYNGNTLGISKDGTITYNGIVIPASTDNVTESIDEGYGRYTQWGTYYYQMDQNGAVTLESINMTVPNAAGAHWDTYQTYFVDGILNYDASAKTLTNRDSGAVYTLGAIDDTTKAAQTAINGLSGTSSKDDVKAVVSQVLALNASQRSDLGTDAIRQLEEQLERVTVPPVTRAPTAPDSIAANSRITVAPTATGLLLAAGVTGAEATPPTVTLAATQKTASSISLPSTISADDAVLAFDLTLTNGAQTIHNLAFPIEVTFTFPTTLFDLQDGNYQILHHRSDGSYELLPLTIEGNVGRFITSSLSTFTVVPVEATLPGSGGGNNNNSGSNNTHPSSSGSVVSTSTPTATFTSDTTADFSVKGSYQFKITSTNGQAPALVVGTAGVFSTQLVKVSGNDYYFKLTAIGRPGAKAGVYVNGVRLLVATVGSAASLVRSDTTLPFSIKKGASYTLKLTADAKPTLTAGTAGSFKVELVKASGKDYFFKITAAGAAGAASGLYINSEKAPVTVAAISR